MDGINEQSAQTEYRDKRTELLNKFKNDPEFIKKYNTYPIYRVTLESLIRGADPYYIIEELLNSYLQLDKTYMKLLAF